jgi:DNA replication protein DnaC
MGWLAYDVEWSHPLFNQIVRCDVCGTGGQTAYLASICGLAPEQRDWTFGNTQRTSANNAAYDVAQLLAGNPQRMLTMLSPGKYGLGKTRLLACVVNAARAEGHTAIYTTTADVLDHLRAAYAPNVTVSYDDRLELLRTCKVLCLDEFDRWAPTAWAQEKFFQLINHRYENSESLLTCFAANAKLDELPAYISSRMQDRRCYLFVMDGQDVRRVRA